MSSGFILTIRNTTTRRTRDILLRMSRVQDDQLFGPGVGSTLPESGIDHSQADREFMAQLLFGISESNAYVSSYCRHHYTHSRLADKQVASISGPMLETLRRAAHRIALGGEGMALQRYLLDRVATERGLDSGVPLGITDELLERLAIYWLSKALSAKPNGTRELRAARLLTRLMTADASR